MSSARVLKLILILPIFIPLLVTPNHAYRGCTQTAEYCWDCSDVGNYSATSVYKGNLDKVLTYISSSSPSDQNFKGFYHVSFGQNPDKVNVITLCRGDLTPDNCRSCLNESNYRLLKSCPNKKEAILWDERCVLRYSSSDSIFSLKEDEPSMGFGSPQNRSDAQQFKQKLKPLLDSLRIKAAAGDSFSKYAQGYTTVSKAEPIFAVLQCTPDLSQNECDDCLQDAISRLRQCCDGKQGARILKPRCNLRYEPRPFFEFDNALQNDSNSLPDAEFCWSCSDVSNDNSIGTYEENLKSLLSSFFSSNQTRNQVFGFYNSSLGENPNTVYAIALCRGDLSLDDCHSCVSISSERLLSQCPSRREAIMWDEQCMVRFSDKSIFSLKQDDPRKYVPGRNKVLEPDLFKRTLNPLLDNLTSMAASGDSQRKYASGESTVPGYKTIYATAQCTPDLDKQQCIDCLQDAASFIPLCCDGAQGARLLKPSCILRYEVTPFFAATDDYSPVSPNSSRKGKSKTTITVVAAVIPTVIAATLVGICIFLKLRKSCQKHGSIPNEITWAPSLVYDFGTIGAATDNFSEENKLGEGGLRAVYKGRLPDGQYVAVKRLSKTSCQGDREFKNEVVLFAKLQHRNLVRLLGFCLQGNERLLVHEYVANSSLDRFIFDSTKRAHLDWYRRYKIIQGIVQGLLYLHEDSGLRIIHRDLKASNILLDEEMNPKISGFGMARSLAFDQTQGSTSRIVGTYGYMAPEYALYGHFSIKSDVYSFGVLLLEIMSGQKNNCFCNGQEVEDLLTYAWENWMNGTASNIIDPAISASSMNEIMRCIHIGLLCVQENRTDRPTMKSVALMLNNYFLTIGVPSKPAFFMHRSSGLDMFSTSNTSGTMRSDSVKGSMNEASITELDSR